MPAPPSPDASLRQRGSLAIWFCEQVIGERLRARSDEGRRTELIIAGNLLNRMFRMARPSYVRVA